MKRFVLLSGLISLVVFGVWMLPDAQAQDVASDLLGRINQLRAEQGLPAYRLNNTLNAAAQNQASWMANTGQVSHTQTDGSSVRDRATAAGYGSSWVSENIYMGPLATVDSAWRFWLNSPIHYRGLTSANYQDIGIATAIGSGGQSFVLVFGNPGGRVASVPRGNNSNAAESSGPPPPPPYFKGVDEQGYLLHEIQPGDTMGDIALIYGYTWDDIPQILESNDLAPDDQRNLAVGEILRVPPQAGTYTPTPSDSSDSESTAQATDPASLDASSEAISEATSQNESVAGANQVDTEGILPTPTTGSDSPAMPATATPQNGLVQPETYTQPTGTPAPTLRPTRLPVTQAAMRVATLPSAANPTTDPAAQTVSSQPNTADSAAMQASPTPAQTPPLWLILAVGIQVLVLAVASVEYVRRH